MSIDTADTVRQQVEPLLKGRQHERVEINFELYRYLLGMRFTPRWANVQTTVVTRQKLRQVHSQFIARLVAQRLES